MRSVRFPALPQLVVQGGVYSGAIVHRHRGFAEHRLPAGTGGAC